MLHPYIGLRGSVSTNQMTRGGYVTETPGIVSGVGPGFAYGTGDPILCAVILLDVPKDGKATIAVPLGRFVPDDPTEARRRLLAHGAS